jgi:cytochrome b
VLGRAAALSVRSGKDFNVNSSDHGERTSADTSAGIIKVPVWDLVVRVGHWTLVACVAYALFVRPQFPGHEFAGYVILGIVLWRWLWGFIGSPYARFSAFIFSARETLQYTLSAFRMGEAREYTSHNPIGL